MDVSELFSIPTPPNNYKMFTRHLFFKFFLFFLMHRLLPFPKKKKKNLEKKNVTLDPRHGTLALDLQPSTLDPRQKDRLRIKQIEEGVSLSIRRFWGKGEKRKRKRERGEGEKRLTHMLLLEPSTPTRHDSIPSNQNHFRSLGCQLHVSKSSPKINLTLRSGRAPVLVLLRFRFFLKPPMRSFRILVM